MRRNGGGLRQGAFGKPLLVAIQPAFVAQAQVLVADALAARQHRVHELLGFELVAVTLTAHLKPFHGVPSSVLNFQGFNAAALLVVRQHLRNLAGLTAMNFELACQFNRIF